MPFLGERETLRPGSRGETGKTSSFGQRREAPKIDSRGIPRPGFRRETRRTFSLGQRKETPKIEPRGASGPRSRGEIRELFSFGQRKEAPKIEPKEKPKGTSLFGDKKEISRAELRRKLEEASPGIPGTSRKFNRRERIAFEKEFGKKGSVYLSKHKVKERIREWERERYREKSTAKRQEIKDKISFSKKLYKSQ